MIETSQATVGQTKGLTQCGGLVAHGSNSGSGLKSLIPGDGTLTRRILKRCRDDGLDYRFFGDFSG